MLSISLFQTAPVSKFLGTFAKPEIRIGKRPGCDVQVEGVGISGVHAVLSFVDGRWFVLDSGAAKPVRLDSTIIPYKQRVELPSGSRLMLKDVVIQVTYG